MKRYIKSDWQYNSSPEINSVKYIMAHNIDKQEEGKVGIFWYDTNKKELFGVKDVSVSDVPFCDDKLFHCKAKTCSQLHYSVWSKEQHRNKDSRFKGDYTLVPRGRVCFVEGQGFIVLVGDWIDKYPEAKQEIIFEFDLPEDTQFQKDFHWNIGHGWSDKFTESEE